MWKKLVGSSLIQPDWPVSFFFEGECCNSFTQTLTVLKILLNDSSNVVGLTLPTSINLTTISLAVRKICSSMDDAIEKSFIWE